MHNTTSLFFTELKHRFEQGERLDRGSVCRESARDSYKDPDSVRVTGWSLGSEKDSDRG